MMHVFVRGSWQRQIFLGSEVRHPVTGVNQYRYLSSDGRAGYYAEYRLRLVAEPPLLQRYYLW